MYKKNILNGILFVVFMILISLQIDLFAYSQAELISANNLAKSGVIKDNSAKPELYSLDGSVLRQEIALVSRRVSGIKENTFCKGIFDDLTATNPNTWACKNIEALVENKLISANTSFNPEKKISKSEALIMFIRAIGFNDFVIDSNSSKNWQEQVVDFAVKNKITTRFTDYNTYAKRGWIFQVADFSLKIKEDRINKGIWDNVYDVDNSSNNGDITENTNTTTNNSNNSNSNIKCSLDVQKDIEAKIAHNLAQDSKSGGIAPMIVGSDKDCSLAYSSCVAKSRKTYDVCPRGADGTFTQCGYDWGERDIQCALTENNCVKEKLCGITTNVVQPSTPIVTDEEKYDATYESANNLIDRCKLYNLATYKGVNNLETYTCDSITNMMNLDYHWYDFNPNADGTLYLTIRNNDKKGDIELYVKGYGTLIGKAGKPIFFKVPNVINGKTVSYRLKAEKGVHYYVRVDFNKLLDL